MAYILPELPYDYSDLEPFIDEPTMKLHHDMHHAGYVKKLNDALADNAELMELSIGDLLRRIEEVPEDIRSAVKNNGGGHFNHTLFWNIMKTDGGGEPEGELAQKIMNDFQSFSSFKDSFSAAAATVFGSGWAWLVMNGSGNLEIIKTSNQDTPISMGMTPLLTLDVWEHAYYLKYNNRRPEYIDAWWNVINWNAVSKNMESPGKDGVLTS